MEDIIIALALENYIKDVQGLMTELDRWGFGSKPEDQPVIQSLNILLSKAEEAFNRRVKYIKNYEEIIHRDFLDEEEPSEDPEYPESPEPAPCSEAE